MRKDVKEVIDAAARAAAEAVLEGQRCTYSTNYYRAMESLLSNYPTLKALVDDETQYMACVRLPATHSKDIVLMRPSGGDPRDADEVMDDLWRARQNAYLQTRTRFDGIDRVVKQFEDRPGFVVVRMYYFGEDEHGKLRGPDEPRYTWDEIAMAIGRSERTARAWRTEIVQDMAVCMFGSVAAISIQTHREQRTAEAK